MSKTINPIVTGNVNFWMSSEDARILVDALDALLSVPSVTWIDKRLRDEVPGQTCDQFVKALRKVVGE